MINLSSKRQKIVTILLAFFISFLIFSNVAVPKIYAAIDPGASQLLSPPPAGMPVADVALYSRSVWKTISDMYNKYFRQAIAAAFKTSAKIFLSKIAYDTANYLATGDVGQKPLYYTQPWKYFIKDAGDAALGGFLDELTKDFGRFNICEPSTINVKLAIHTSLFQSRYPIKPRCTFSEMQKNWTKWQQEVRQEPGKFVRDLKESFNPEENDIGMYLSLHSSLLTAQEEAKLNAWLERSVNQGIKDVTSPITGAIKTPALLLGEKFATMDEKTGQVEFTYTGEIVDAFLGTFTNTLMSKWMDTLFKKGFNVAEESSSIAGLSSVLNQSGYNVERAQQHFASLAEVNFTSGQENVLNLLTLPAVSIITDAPAGPTNEVITDQFASAVREKITLKEAIDKGFIDGIKPVGFDNSGEQPNYRDGYPYRSLVILRTHRIAPVGWELAAMYHKKYGETSTINFNYLINCYEDPTDPGNPYKPFSCREDTNGNGIIPEAENNSNTPGEKDFNPYYHLVDPNWVLKSPETYCKRKGPGPEIVNDQIECLADNVRGTANNQTDAEGNVIQVPIDGPNCQADVNPDLPVRVVQRNTDYCGDWQSCILENDEGSCAAYGYCVKEKPIWHFEGEQCPAYYNSCESFSSPSGKQYSFLRNTLKNCNQSEAGCAWYSTAATPVSATELAWSSLERIYLNEEAQSCDGTNAGCTKLGRMLPGINLAFNGSFSEPSSNNLPLGWQVNPGAPASCNYIHDVDTKEMEISGSLVSGQHCQLDSSGFIPLNPEFTYSFSYKIKSPTGATAYVGLVYYDANKVICGSGHVAPCNTPYGHEMFDGAINVTSGYTYHQWDIGPEAVSNVDLLPGAKYVKISIKAPAESDSTILIDDIQFAIVKSPVLSHNLENFTINPETYRFDYSLGQAFNSYLKVPPDYLDCESGNSAYCDNYADVCLPEEVGCQGYTPLVGGPEIPAKTSPADVCPAECNGYESYLQLVNYFEEIEDPVAEPIYQYFIPQTATECPLQDVGCEQFTNLDEVAQGGEGIEYFTYLRQCISANSGNIQAYFTWEGSDTTGYQLKKWELLRSGTNAPCTNIIVGTEQCQDAAFGAKTCGPETPSNPDDDPEVDPNCRDFIDASGNHYFRLQQYLITASGECHPYRRTATGQIYNADPYEGKTCASSSNNCREYKGNIGNNVRNLINVDFEDGTVGNFTNTNGSTAGLVISNESVYQSGHSLKVGVSNDTIVYPLSGQLKINRQYKLSFWAKKVDIGAGNKASMVSKSDNSKFRLVDLFTKKTKAQPMVTILSFSQIGLTDEWQLYSLGPVELESVQPDSQMELTINGLTPAEGFYIDNIILQEFMSNFYVIRDSWNTPLSCDEPFVGAQLGCSAYRDRQNTINYLKSFDYICSLSRVGCEAFVTTQNSSLSQAEQTYFATCDNYVGEIGSGACSNPAIPGSGSCCTIRGVEKCNVPGGQDFCQYENITVPNDELIYLINDAEKTCNSGQKGCEMMGSPTLDRSNDYFSGGDYDDYLDNYIQGYTTAYMINDPDQYSSQLCSESGLFCTTLTGELTGTNYYFDPYSLGTTGDDGSTVGLTCYYDSSAGIWRKSVDDQPCSATEFMSMVGQEDYEGWVGLCSSAYSTCTEYRDPEQPAFDKAQECDATITPQMRGICGDGDHDESIVTVNGRKYCQKIINGISHKVCQIRTVGGVDVPCPYTEYDWICADSAIPPGGYFCKVPGTSKNACYVGQGQSLCFYSLACQSYYYKAKSVKTCESGIVDREAGCLLFNDTSNPNLTLSSNLTADGQSPQSPVAGCSSDYNSADNCDANTSSPLKVRRDRECAETLFCTSSVEVTDDQGNASRICLGVGRCKKVDPDNPYNCLEISASPVLEEQTYSFNLANTSEGVDSIRYLSGYSKAGLIWNDVNDNREEDDLKDKIIKGYYPPEQMYQLGDDLAINNGGFENTGNTVADILDWSFLTTPVGNCSYGLDNNNPYTGTYSLRTRLNQDSNYCNATNGLYNINPGKSYIFSFYARSENGAQRIRPEVQFFTASGGFISAARIDVFPSQQWTYYSIILGPDDVNIPNNTRKVKIALLGPHSGDGIDSKGDIGNVWFDEVQFKPALKTAEKQLAVKECRLYPEDDALACEYTDYQTHRGWYGYCLEHDPKNSSACLQWYPVDSIAGASLVTLGQSAIGYDNRLPLYYCLQSGGKYEIGKVSSPNTGYLTSGYKIQSHKAYSHENCSDCPQCDAGNFPSGAPGHNFYFCEDSHNFTDPVITLNSGDADYKNFTVDDVAKITVDVVYQGGGWLPPGEHKLSGPSSVTNPSGIPAGNYYKFVYEHNYPPPGDNGTNSYKVDLYFVDSLSSPDNKRLKYIYFYFNDNTSESGGATFDLYYYLREPCPYIAKAVRGADEGGNIKEKSWYTRYKYGWSTSAGNAMGYNKEMTEDPYGSSPVSGTNPAAWTGQYTPLTIYRGDPRNSEISAHNFSGMPFTVPQNTTYPQRVCVGGPLDNQPCLDSYLSDDSDNDCYEKGCSSPPCGGVCMGVGKYCYSNQTFLTNGDTCNSNADCFGEYPFCRAPSLTVNNAPQEGLLRLQQLYADIYGIWEFDEQSGRYDLLCSKSNPLACSLGDTNIADTTGTAPYIGNIKLNGHTGDVDLTAPGGVVNLSFTTDLDNDHMPLESVGINWMDGGGEDTYDVSMSEQPADSNPHRLAHFYGCVPNSEGDHCVFCWDAATNSWIDSYDGSCTYQGPWITVQDHWEWCPDGYQGDDYTCDPRSNGIQYLGGRIHINPRTF
ncbi:hypothetical protein KKF32_01995 [Patescibacteria group bacterium]|nr:hypothetical protein [Patescibacteria group bacterium]